VLNPCSVFWTLGTSATLDTASSFVGTIIATESITLNTLAILNGKALALNGAVTLDTNTITNCNTVSSCPSNLTICPVIPTPTNCSTCVNGTDGLNGFNGTNGVNGTDGVSIINATIDSAGDLLLGLSNGVILDPGHVVGPAGLGCNQTLVNSTCTQIQCGDNITIICGIQGESGICPNCTETNTTTPCLTQSPTINTFTNITFLCPANALGIQVNLESALTCPNSTYNAQGIQNFEIVEGTGVICFQLNNTFASCNCPDIDTNATGTANNLCILDRVVVQCGCSNCNSNNTCVCNQTSIVETVLETLALDTSFGLFYLLATPLPPTPTNTIPAGGGSLFLSSTGPSTSNIFNVGYYISVNIPGVYLVSFRVSFITGVAGACLEVYVDNIAQPGTRVDMLGNIAGQVTNTVLVVAPIVGSQISIRNPCAVLVVMPIAPTIAATVTMELLFSI